MKTTISNSDAARLPDNDNRPFIKDLLAKHSAAVEGVRNAIQSDENKICKDLYNHSDNANRYDDIWILRFVLSHKGNVTSASKAALATIRFRDEKKLNELGDIRHRIRSLGVCADDILYKNGSKPLPGHKLYNSFCAENAAFTTLPDKDRGIIFYSDIGKIDVPGLAKGMSEEDLKYTLMHYKEATFQVLDDVTRRTGRLTKLMQILDMSNCHLRNLSRTYIKRDGACNKALEDYYPQALGCVYIANSPSWLSALWFAVRPFFPKRFVEKTDFLPSLPKLKKSKETYLKSMSGYVALEHLPERYGGMNKEWPQPCLNLQFQPPSSSQ